MKKLVKLVTAMSLCLTLIASSSVLPVNAAGTKQVKYVAIGDSITEAKPGYVDLVSKGIGAVTTKNAGVSGWTSQDIMTQVRTATDVRASLRSATTVTIDVGSNDITYAIGDSICDILGCGKSYEAFMAKIESMQREYNKATGFYKFFLDMQMMYKASQVRNAVYSQTNINKASATFKSNLTNTVKEVRALNPNAKIYIGNLYNPYNGSADISIAGYKIFNAGEVVELWETTFNKTVSQVASSTGCTLVNIHPLFTDTSLLLGDAKNNWDPHPNQAGHKAIANAFLAKMK